MYNWLSVPIHFQYPELFLLGIPAAYLFYHFGRAPGVTGWLRGLLLALMILVLTVPEWDLGGRGVDVVVVVDRSRSMMADAESRIKELIVNLQRARGTGDRVGIVTFGQSAAVELMPTHDGGFREFGKVVLPDGSDLEAGLQTALNLIDPYRPSRILVLSDGEANGPPLSPAIRRAQEGRVPIDFRAFERVRTGDAAIQSLMLPEIVSPREPFQFTVVVQSDKEVDGTLTVFRDGKQLSRVTRHFVHGANPVLFRDLLEAGGLRSYEARLEIQGDPLTENNSGAGVVRVEADRRLLVLNGDGKEDNFIRALRAAKLPVDVASSTAHPLTQDSLEAYRAVVLENVPARNFGRLKMERLAQFVEDLGGGLLLTGGERSFGTGGYFKSPLDPVLPVSMEMRQEHRKMNMALAVVLDRSGSMAVPVSGGRTKMDLADLGTAECIRLLSPGDSVAVIAVDSTPHVIQELTPVQDPESIAQRALTIESQGGGIFIYEGLVAGGDQLLKAEQLTKHIILFSDAQDSEEPGAYQSLLEKYEAAGITVSVIGLGNDTDVDAELLKDIAKRGRGNIMFTTDPEELPRLFSEDTMSIARSSFVKKDEKTQPAGISGRLLADARLMGEMSAGAFPNVDGYNLSYLKPKATMGVMSQDEFSAPWSAFWFRGLGRAAAITLEVDGVFSGQFGRWDRYSDFLITHARWLLGDEQPDTAFLKVEQDGQDALVTLELDPDRPGRKEIDSPLLTVIPPGDERAKPREIPFEWQGANTLQARFKLDQVGTFRPLVKLGPRNFVRGPTVTLPYSPEFAPRIDTTSGADILKSLAEKTGGQPRVNPLEVFADPPRSSSKQPLAIYLLMGGLSLLILEIAGRRLSLWEKLPDMPLPAFPQLGKMLATRNTTKVSAAQKRATTAATVTSAAPEPKPTTETKSATAPASTPAVDPFSQAKARAKRRGNS